MSADTLLPIKASSDRLIKVFLVLVVLLTGPVLSALQAILFGVVGNSGNAFAISVAAALAVDLTRLAPLLFISNRREGILHPLIVTALLWPVALQLPYFVETLLASLGGFDGSTLRAPHYAALSAASDREVWLAVAKYDAFTAISLLCLYLGYFVAWDRGVTREKEYVARLGDEQLRPVLLGICMFVLVGLVAFLFFQGGLLTHLAELSRGRARALEGLGPLVVAFDLGAIAVMLWMAARPQDAKNPAFIVMLLAMVAVQFISNGSRSSAILVVAGTGLVWALTTRKVPTRLGAFVVPTAIVLLFILAIIRGAGSYGQTAADAVMNIDREAVAARMHKELNKRRYLTGSIPLVANPERYDGPLLGSTYVAAVVAPIPRPIWPGKPRGAGSRFAQQAFGTDELGFAVPIGPTAEAYWNFGIVGVAVLFLLHGILLAKVHSIWRRRFGDPFVTVAFAIFLMNFRFGTDDLVPWMQKMGALGLIWLLAAGLGKRRATLRTAPGRAMPMYRRIEPAAATPTRMNKAGRHERR